MLLLGTPPIGLRACHPHIARAAGITRSVFTFSYALHLTSRYQVFTPDISALDNRHCNSLLLSASQSIAQLIAFYKRKNRSIQTLIFNQQSASCFNAAVCVRSYYFVHFEPLKITKSAFSSTQFQSRKSRGSEVRHLTRHTSLSFFKRRNCVVQVFKYNRFDRSCKPPPLNRLEACAEADAQSNQAVRDVNPCYRHETRETWAIRKAVRQF